VVVQRRSTLDGRLPAVRVSSSVKADVKRLADKFSVKEADVVRTAVEFFLSQSGTDSTKICNNHEQESQA